MPVPVALQAIPNQSFSVLLDGITYKVTIKDARGIMAVSISLDGELVVSGSRFFTDSPLIPYPYLEGSGGNFAFTSEADALPDFEEFGTTQFLIYVSAEELSDARS